MRLPRTYRSSPQASPHIQNRRSSGSRPEPLLLPLVLRHFPRHRPKMDAGVVYVTKTEQTCVISRARKGRGGKLVGSTLASANHPRLRWAIRIGMALLPVGMPLVLLFPEGNFAYRVGEMEIVVSAVHVKCNVDRLCMFAILIDKHQRPLSVRTVQRISSHQHVTLVILYITGGQILNMLLIDGLGPLPRDDLRGVKLRRGLLIDVVLIHHKEVIGPPTIRTDRMRRGI